MQAQSAYLLGALMSKLEFLKEDMENLMGQKMYSPGEVKELLRDVEHIIRLVDKVWKIEYVSKMEEEPDGEDSTV